jgi:ApbE superfamily uncharacterized protein (UPF0280 family)
VADGSALSGPVLARSADGARLHLQHGPIDVIVRAFGPPHAVAQAEGRAWERFRTILDELVVELPTLRQPARPGVNPSFEGSVARRMDRAVAPFAGRFITPMAAVAGAVADELCAVISADGDLQKLYVNDGGDIALYLADGEGFSVGVVPVPERPALLGKITIHASDPARGIATSGRHGRSFSLGIADAVTVLAPTAAAADAAATLVANAVDLPGHPAIRRVPAVDLDPDSDLGERPVTVEVGPLGNHDIAAALAAGAQVAEGMRADGSIVAAVLSLDDAGEVVGHPSGDGRR